jgi:hypothetical protein
MRAAVVTKAVRQAAVRHDGAKAKAGDAGINTGQTICKAHGHVSLLIFDNLDLGAQAIQLQLLQQRLALVRGAVDISLPSVLYDKDIMLDLALGREQRAIGPLTKRQLRHIASQKVVQKGERRFARQPDDGAGGKNLCCEW